jgi:hypothetical protein
MLKLLTFLLVTRQADELGNMYTIREDCKEFKIYRKGKDIIKKINKNFKLCVVTNLSAP